MTQSRAKLEKKIDKYARKGRFDKAIAECQKLLSIFKGDLEIRQRLAELLSQGGNDPEAIRTYFKLAKRYIKNERPEQAVRIFNRILSLDPGHVDTRMQLADLALAADNQELAVSNLADAAETLARRDNVRACLQFLDRISQIQPEVYEHRLRIAGVFAEMGQINTAAGEFSRAMLTLKHKGRNTEAVAAAKRAVDLGPTDVEVLCELGEALSDLDQWELVERIESRVKSIRRGEIQEPQETDDIPIDVEEPPAQPARLAAVDLVAEDRRTTEEVPVPRGKAAQAPAGESDIYSELFGDDEEAED